MKISGRFSAGRKDLAMNRTTLGINLRRIKLAILYSWGLVVYGRRDLFLGVSARVAGLKYITFKGSVGAGRDFKISAIDCYAGVHYSPKIEIGKNVSFGDLCHVSAIKLVSIGDNVLMGSKVHITDHAHGRFSADAGDQPGSAPIHRQLFSKGPVYIEENVWICDGVVILSNVRIGKGSIIGANSVVTRDIPEGVIAAGQPASVIKRFNGRGWAPA